MEHLSYDNRLDKKLGLMRLSDGRVRGDLIETLKIASDTYDLRKEDFSSLILAAAEGTLKSYLRKGADWILESTHLVTE